MRKLVVGMFMSLDGVVQAPGAPDEDPEGGFTDGGWTVPLSDEQFGQVMTELIQRSSALLLGRKTYQVHAAAWPAMGDSDPIAAKLNSIPKYVASRTLKTADEWANTTILSGDVAEEVAKLKQTSGGEIHTSGSGNLIQTLLRADLVDEFSLLVFPVVLGSGKRLFGDGTIPRSLELVDTKTLGTGIMVNTYRRRGPLEVGTMGPE